MLSRGHLQSVGRKNPSEIGADTGEALCLKFSQSVSHSVSTISNLYDKRERERTDDNETYRQCPNELHTHKVPQRHLLEVAADGPGIDIVDSAIGVHDLGDIAVDVLGTRHLCLADRSLVGPRHLSLMKAKGLSYVL